MLPAKLLGIEIQHLITLGNNCSIETNSFYTTDPTWLRADMSFTFRRTTSSPKKKTSFVKSIKVNRMSILLKYYRLAFQNKVSFLNMQVSLELVYNSQVSFQNKKVLYLKASTFA